MMQGYIKLSRCILQNCVFDNPELLKVWVWCLLKASHKKHKHAIGSQVVELEKGQFIFGRKQAAIELKMSESKVYRLMKILEKTEKTNSKPNNKFSVVTIVNWELYQGAEVEPEQQDEQQVNNKRTTNEQQMNTNKNDKKGKNGKKEKNKDIPPKKPFGEFVELTQEQHQKLLSDYGEARLNGMIEILNTYLGASGKKYKSHYHVLLPSAWVYGKYKDPPSIYNTTGIRELD